MEIMAGFVVGYGADQTCQVCGLEYAAYNRAVLSLHTARSWVQRLGDVLGVNESVMVSACEDSVGCVGCGVSACFVAGLGEAVTRAVEICDDWAVRVVSVDASNVLPGGWLQVRNGAGPGGSRP